MEGREGGRKEEKGSRRFKGRSKKGRSGCWEEGREGRKRKKRSEMLEGNNRC